MSMLFFDGFDGYDSVFDAETYGGWYNIATSVNRIALVTGRTGTGKGFNFSATVDYNWADVYTPDQSGKTLYIGFAFKDSNVTGVSGNVLNFTQTTAANTPQALVYYDAVDKVLQLRLGNGTVLATSSMSMVYNSWYYVEVKYLCHNTTGVFELRVNESVVASYTGDTQYQSTDSVVMFKFCDCNIVSTLTHPAAHSIDDIYILNSDGATNNTYLGDVQCTMLAPSADYSTTFTPTGAVSNYLCVDEAVGAPDNNTTYVSSSTVGAVDEYSIPNIVASSVHAVKVNTRAMKDDVNPRNMKHGIRTGTNANEVEYVLGENYGNYIDVFDDQGDGTPWDETSFNAARSMIKVQS